MDLNDIDQWSRALLQNEARKRGVRTPEVYSRGELIRLILRHDYRAGAGVRGAAKLVGGLLGTAKVALKVGLSRLEPERLPRGWERGEEGRDPHEHRGWKDTSSGFERAAPVDASLATSPGEVAAAKGPAAASGSAAIAARGDLAEPAALGGSPSGADRSGAATQSSSGADPASQTSPTSSGSLPGADVANASLSSSGSLPGADIAGVATQSSRVSSGATQASPSSSGSLPGADLGGVATQSSRVSSGATQASPSSSGAELAHGSPGVATQTSASSSGSLPGADLAGVPSPAATQTSRSSSGALPSARPATQTSPSSSAHGSPGAATQASPSSSGSLANADVAHDSPSAATQASPSSSGSLANADVAHDSPSAATQASPSSSGSLQSATPSASSQTSPWPGDPRSSADIARGASQGSPASSDSLPTATLGDAAAATSGGEPHVGASSRANSARAFVRHRDTTLNPWADEDRAALDIGARGRATAPESASDEAAFPDEGLTEPQPQLAAAVARDDAEREELSYGPHPSDGLHVSWRVGSDAIHRARAVLGAHGELAVRVVAVRVEDSANVRTETLDHGPVASSGDWTAPLAPTAGRYVTAVGLRSGDRFVSIVHAALK